MPGLGTGSPQGDREIEREGKKGGGKVRADGGNGWVRMVMWSGVLIEFTYQVF